MSVPLKDYRIDVPKRWKEAVKRCKVMTFLNEDSGQNIVSDFYSDLKALNGSRFKTAFELAVKPLSRRVLSYWLVKGIEAEPYRQFHGDVVACLVREFSPPETVEIVATCIFWILHDQSLD